MFTIRPLGLGDAEEYWRIRLEALDSEPLAFGSSGEEERAKGLEALTSQHLRESEGGSFLLGGFAEGRLAGIVGFGRSDRLKTRHAGGVYSMYVVPDFRGRGLGRALLIALIERVRGYEGLEQVGLTVTTEAPAARALYRSLGFESFGVERRALKVGERYADMEPYDAFPLA